MTALAALDIARWDDPAAAHVAAQATRELEAGKILFLPRLGFTLAAGESRFLAPEWADGKAKNISYDPPAGGIRHASAQGDDRRQLAQLMARFAGQARQLVLNVCPAYAGELQDGLTSLRPVQVRGRKASRTKDDTLLHVDAFASRPTQGRRILRVFCNLNPRGEPRVWQIGEPFEAVASRFCGSLPPQLPGSAWLLERLRITKRRRSPYDHIMLSLHDRLKRDTVYQAGAPRERIEFPAPSTWIVFTDRVMHAAIEGQHALEQTFYLPLTAMHDERHAPLRVLERCYRRKLA
jgi:hypothetical protein